MRWHTPTGFAPDVTRPLRAEPVRRDEVLIKPWSWELATMPTGTFRVELRHHASTITGHAWTWHWLVGDPDLWRPLLDRLAVEMAAERALHEQWRRASPALWGAAPKEKPLPKPEFLHSATADALREYDCEHCGARHLRHALKGPRVCVCSNRCERERHKARQRQRRKDTPPNYRAVNAKRTARRAAARTGLVCEHCGQSFEASRSTRRFCSDICRVWWHRANPQAAQ